MSDLTHESGHFFRVQGVRARCDFPAPLRFEQPIVNQPEIGVLGILAKRFDGVLHFLLQAKMEPGNIDLVQFADGSGDAQQLHLGHPRPAQHADPLPQPSEHRGAQRARLTRRPALAAATFQ